MISLIIPSYNTEKHLINTYNSIRKYYKNIEMVIINDGSTDNTSKWLDALEDDNVVKINSKERRGHTYFYDEGIDFASLEVDLKELHIRFLIRLSANAVSGKDLDDMYKSMPDHFKYLHDAEVSK